MNCKYYRTRTKKGIKYGYCTKYKKEISLFCKECEKIEYKQYKTLKAEKEYRYKPKKGKCNRYYNNISIMPENSLYSTAKVKGLEKHHIFCGITNRPLSEKYGLFVWLSKEQHRYLTDNPLENLKLKEIAQTAFMKKYDKTEEDFIKVFGRNYL